MGSRSQRQRASCVSEAGSGNRHHASSGKDKPSRKRDSPAKKNCAASDTCSNQNPPGAFSGHCREPDQAAYNGTS